MFICFFLSSHNLYTRGSNEGLGQSCYPPETPIVEGLLSTYLLPLPTVPFLQPLLPPQSTPDRHGYKENSL